MFKSASSLNIKDEDRNSSLNNNNNKCIRKNYSPKLKTVSNERYFKKFYTKKKKII